MESAAPEERAGELDQAFVVVGVFVVADEDRAAFGEPGEGAFDDPASGVPGLLAPAIEFLFADVSDVADLVADGLPGRVVVAFVEA